LYQANTFGVVDGEREALAQGIVESLFEAHQDFEDNAKNGNQFDVGVHVGKIKDIARNRSPSSYMMNPESERAQYETNIDEEMILLSFKEKASGKLRASFNWHAVHGVTMTNMNKFVSGDNKGFASYMVETLESQKGNSVIASFSISNAGDVTPSTRTPRCADSGLECDGGPTSCMNEKGMLGITKVKVEYLFVKDTMNLKNLNEPSASEENRQNVPWSCIVRFLHLLYRTQYFLDMHS
jgi:neutral ceramidase